MESPAVGVWNGVVRFATLALVSSLVARLHASVRRERWLARTDPLTGAANARTFYEMATAETERAGRTRRPLTLAYLDLDNFKQLNDRLGHTTGDEALVRVVQLVQGHLRGLDLLARLGGDEFALLLPETGPEGAAALLGRLQEVLSQEMAQRGWPVSLSVGAVTFLRPAWDVDRMVQRADAVMYQAKRKGKGRVELAVVREGLAFRPEAGQEPERRATVRVLCDRTARVHQDGQENRAALRDISAAGIGLYLEERVAPDSVLVVEPLFPDARTQLARVVHAMPQDGKWLHGCHLSVPLTAEELAGWLGTRQPFPHGSAVRPSDEYLAFTNGSTK